MKGQPYETDILNTAAKYIETHILRKLLSHTTNSNTFLYIYKSKASENSCLTLSSASPAQKL